MPVNPAVKPEMLNNPTQRANSLNDPQFSEQQGYFPYDLSHGEYITPRFGEGTPTMHLDTVPADRFAVHDNTKLVLNRIQGNLLSTLNQYVDSFYVPLRSCFPNNYEKLIPNPTKGSDLPNSALPQIPFHYWINQLYRCKLPFTINGDEVNHLSLLQDPIIYLSDEGDSNVDFANYGLSWMLLITSMLSRGQLLDYLGVQYDDFDFVNSSNDYQSSKLQQVIDEFWQALYAYCEYSTAYDYIKSFKLNLLSNDIQYPSTFTYSAKADTISRWRSAIADIFERGEFPVLNFDAQDPSSDEYVRLHEAYLELYTYISFMFANYDYNSLSMVAIDENPTPWENGGFLNITKPLAYQQIFAHYYSNDSIDNIFTSELYMQNLRAVMYPTGGRFTSEPVFEYNGVQTEYDYMSCAGWFYSLMSIDSEEVSAPVGFLARSWVVATLLFLMRRTLRYGDYFSTARPRMLAVGQLNVAVGHDADGNPTGVSPIDITKNLLMQRYLNAANYVGSRFLNYYASMYGVTPSDTGTFPRFLAHRKIELQNQITNNTADEQGAQTTNLVGYSDTNAFDVFIDDFGVLLSITSFDVLPVYTSGIDSSYHFSDRFDYFNPMLQNVGDQPIRFTELVGAPGFHDTIFGWTMRNAELKFKISRAHGAFVNDLPGFLIKYPFSSFGSRDASGASNFVISPEFIRDKPRYLDPYVPAITGASPANYFHFVCACLNQVHCARKVQAQPPVLF